MIEELRYLLAEWLLSKAFAACPKGQLKKDLAAFIVWHFAGKEPKE